MMAIWDKHRDQMEGVERTLPPMLLWKKNGIRAIKHTLIVLMGPNVPSANERLRKFVLISDGLEVICVSLRVVILSFERLTTLTLTARIVTDLMR